MQEQPRALDMAQKLVTQPDTLRRTLDQPWDVSQHEAVVAAACGIADNGDP